MSLTRFAVVVFKGRFFICRGLLVLACVFPRPKMTRLLQSIFINFPHTHSSSSEREWGLGSGGSRGELCANEYDEA